MYKLYSENGQIIIEDASTTVFQVNANDVRLQVIDGIIYVYDLFNKPNHLGQLSGLNLGSVSNVKKSDGVSGFSNAEQLYDYWGTISGTTSTTVSVKSVDASGNSLNPAGIPIMPVVELIRPADASPYAIGDSISDSTTAPSPIVFPTVTVSSNGGGYLGQLIAETNMTSFANAQLRCYFFNDPSILAKNDNSPYTLSYSNRSKFLFYVDITFDPLESTSDEVRAQSLPVYIPFTTPSSLAMLVQTRSAVTPTSGGSITFKPTIIKIA